MREKILPVMKALEAELKELKKTYRDPKQQPPKPATYSGIWRRQREATLFYCAIAASRGHVHRKCDTLETQQEFLDKNAEFFESKLAA